MTEPLVLLSDVAYMLPTLKP